MRVPARPVSKFWIEHNRKLGRRDTIVIFNSIGSMYPEDLNPDTKGTMNRLNGKVTAKFMAASASVIAKNLIIPGYTLGANLRPPL